MAENINPLGKVFTAQILVVRVTSLSSKITPLMVRPETPEEFRNALISYKKVHPSVNISCGVSCQVDTEEDLATVIEKSEVWGKYAKYGLQRLSHNATAQLVNVNPEVPVTMMELTLNQLETFLLEQTSIESGTHDPLRFIIADCEEDPRQLKRGGGLVPMQSWEKALLSGHTTMDDIQVYPFAMLHPSLVRHDDTLIPFLQPPEEKVPPRGLSCNFHRGCLGAAHLDGLLEELAFKVGFAPKYGS